MSADAHLPQMPREVAELLLDLLDGLRATPSAAELREQFADRIL